MSRVISALVLVALLSGCSLVLPSSGLSGGGGAAGAAGAAGGDGGSPLPGPELVDCRDPGNAGDVVCRPIATLSSGSVGAGPALDWSGVPRQEIVGGYLDGTELVLAIGVGAGSKPGGLLGVDLASGARRVIAGELRSSDLSTIVVGQGFGLQGMADVVGTGPLHSALTVDPFGFAGFIVEVDRASGDRLVAHPLGDGCESSLPSDLFPAHRPPAFAPDTSAYLLAESIQQQGIVRLLGDECDLVVPLAIGGPGYDPNFLTWYDGAIWGVDYMGERLMRYDPSNGAVTTVSQPSSIAPGATVPLGVDDVGFLSERAYSVGALNEQRITEVDLGSGARKPHDATVGPLATPPVSAMRVWAHPSAALLLLAVDGAVVLFDPATDLANTLSY